MSEFFLIAHKVRGEAAFDIAIRLQIGEELGWIIPTSGHRAYPYWSHPLDDLYNHPESGTLCVREMIGTDEVPESLRDHYHTEAQPRPSGGKITALSLADLGL